MQSVSSLTEYKYRLTTSRGVTTSCSTIIIKYTSKKKREEGAWSSLRSLVHFSGSNTKYDPFSYVAVNGRLSFQTNFTNN